jgi:nucleoid-associated protein YgaU
MKREEFGKESDDISESKLSARPEAASTPTAAQAAPKVEYIAEHVMKPDETLSHLSLKYYGSAVREKWMIIYEANKDVIGDNPAHVHPGTVIKIPKLP